MSFNSIVFVTYFAKLLPPVATVSNGAVVWLSILFEIVIAEHLSKSITGDK